MDLAKVILNIVEQETIYFPPMLKQENGNEVVDIDRSDILFIINYPIHLFGRKDGGVFWVKILGAMPSLIEPINCGC